MELVVGFRCFRNAGIFGSSKNVFGTFRLWNTDLVAAKVFLQMPDQQIMTRSGQTDTLNLVHG